MNYLARLRIAKGLTQQQLANLLGHGSAQFVSNQERSRSYPPTKDIKKMAKIFGVPAREIASWIVEQKTNDLKREYAGLLK